MSSTGIAEVNGAQLHYEMAGTGHPLVLVHAGIADSRMWDDQFELFAQHYQVIRYDLRGFGKSPAVIGDFRHYRDLYGVLKFLAIERAYILGCSLGGTTGINLTLEYPELVAALITVGSLPQGFQITGALPAQWAEVEKAFNAGDLECVSELIVQVWVDGEQRTPEQVPAAIRDKVRAMNLIAWQNEKLGLGREQPLDPPAIYRLSEIRIPMLVLNGDLDNPRVLEAGDLMTSQIVGARKGIITGTAHVPNMERPEEFNRLVLEFLNSL